MITGKSSEFTGKFQDVICKFSGSHPVRFCIFTSTLLWLPEVCTGTVRLLTVLATTITCNFSGSHLW